MLGDPESHWSDRLLGEERSGTPRLISTVWLPFSFGYFLSYGLRNINAALAPELTREFGLSAAELGLLTSAYYVAFALVQLPAGLLLDRFGSRRVHALLLIVAAAGCALHAAGQSFLQVALGRALIGVGLSVALMASVKIFAQWFAPARVPLALNMLLACGGVGAMVATGPVGWSLSFVSWRAVFVVFAVLLLVASLVVYFATPERAERSAHDSWAKLASGFVPIFRNGTFWRMSLMMAAVSGTYSAVQSLWIGPWLRDVGGFSRGTSLTLMSVFALAAMAGYALGGIVCDAFIRRGMTAFSLYKVQSAAGIVLFALAAFSNGAPSVPLWFAYFCVGPGGALVLAILSREFPLNFAGRVNTGNNVFMFSIAFLFQWGIGAMLDRWPVLEGHYSLSGYRAAFGILLVLQIAAYVLMIAGGRPARDRKAVHSPAGQ